MSKLVRLPKIGKGRKHKSRIIHLAVQVQISLIISATDEVIPIFPIDNSLLLA